MFTLAISSVKTDCFILRLNSKSVYFSVSEDSFEELSGCHPHSDGELSPNER